MTERAVKTLRRALRTSHIRLVYAFPGGTDFYSNISDLQLFCVDDREIAAMEELLLLFRLHLRVVRYKSSLWILYFRHF